MKRPLKRLGQVLGRKEILSLCLMILAADVVSGIIAPNFSLYATKIGATLALIGVLGAVEGLTRILSSVPVGLLSDRLGRKNVLSGGMLLFAIATVGYSLAPTAFWLLPMRVLIGVAMIATFFVGIAYIGDIVSKQDRGLVIGLYATFMGSGFAVGSALGGHISAQGSFRNSYRVAAIVAVAGFAIARWGLQAQTQPPSASGQKTRARAGFGAILRDRALLGGCVANMVNNAWYSGVVASFFSLYADASGISQATIGTMFALRAAMSTIARLPTGVLSARLGSRRLMLLALAIAAVAVIGISASSEMVPLTVFLAVEGVAYGMYMTSGQAYVTEHADEDMRGTAVGVYSTAGGIGSTVGPFALGIIAELWGLSAVFWAMGAMICVGTIIVAWITKRRDHPEAAPQSALA